MTTVVQLCGCLMQDNDTAPFVSNEAAEFYGVYVGEPGNFQWQADFKHYEDAFTYAVAISRVNDYPLKDLTFTQGNFNDTQH